MKVINPKKEDKKIKKEIKIYTKDELENIYNEIKTWAETNFSEEELKKIFDNVPEFPKWHIKNYINFFQIKIVEIF